VIKLYNTLTRETEEFVPNNPREVKIYTCGPTVYSYQHIGNYTAYIYWDILIRTLNLQDYKVKRVLNITDVGHLSSDGDIGEDKMEKGARAEGKTVWEVAEFFGDDFMKNFRELCLIEPSNITKATDYIEADLDLIRILKSKGFTYETSDGIYYDTSKFSHYADFAHIDLASLKAGARVEFNEEKRGVADFALWKFVKPEEDHAMQWLTPGDLLDRDDPAEDTIMGYPGWHIECSSIIKAELGDTIDIHTGGIDHVPVHHTNEIAQSEAANNKPLSNFWLHNNFITIDGQKISKSLGNTYTFNDIKNRGFSHMDFKMWALQGHFQSERAFTFDNLEAASRRLLSWRNTAALRHQINDTVVRDNDKNTNLLLVPEMILDALNDNLNTPKALAIIDEVFTKLGNSNLSNISRRSLTRLLEFIDSSLGIDLIKLSPDISEDAKKLIMERRRARDNKDFEGSDRLRAEIEEREKIALRDSMNRTTWEYVD
jgi:cysteinyl-tRNA synthetase